MINVEPGALCWDVCPGINDKASAVSADLSAAAAGATEKRQMFEHGPSSFCLITLRPVGESGIFFITEYTLKVKLWGL